MKPELVAPCGMNCQLCIGYFGYTMSGQRRKNTCLGCRSLDSSGKYLSRKNCAFLKAKCPLLKDDKVDHCFECDDFPCQHLQVLDDRYREKYGLSLIENLRCIKRHGMDAFLTWQEGKYRCPDCGGLICLHDQVCYSCREAHKD